MKDIKETENKESIDQKEIKYEKKQIKKVKTCKVLFYDKLKNILHIDFDGFGIQVEYKDKEVKETVDIQYNSEIGKADFTYNLVK
jgi:hypothetical protein